MPFMAESQYIYVFGVTDLKFSEAVKMPSKRTAGSFGFISWSYDVENEEC